MLRINPFLLFDGNCAEAMSFYHQCFGGDLTVTKLGDSEMKDQLPPEKHDRVIYANLKSDRIEISATDWMAAPEFEPKRGNMFSLFVVANKGEEIKEIFDKLAVRAEAERFQELHDLPIGTYGQFTDRYGVQWIFLKEKD